MLQLSRRDLDIFTEDMVEAFVRRSLTMLKRNYPAWYVQQGDVEARVFVQEMIEFADKHQIVKELNIQKLMQCKIDYGFQIPLDGKPKKILSEYHTVEDSRVASFCHWFFSGNHQLILIDLDQY